MGMTATEGSAHHSWKGKGMADVLYVGQRQCPSQTERTSCNTRENFDALHVI